MMKKGFFLDREMILKIERNGRQDDIILPPNCEFTHCWSQQWRQMHMHLPCTAQSHTNSPLEQCLLTPTRIGLKNIVTNLISSFLLMAITAELVIKVPPRGVWMTDY